MRAKSLKQRCQALRKTYKVEIWIKINKSVMCAYFGDSRLRDRELKRTNR